MSDNRKTELQDALKAIHDTNFNGDEGMVMKAIHKVILKEYEDLEERNRRGSQELNDLIDENSSLYGEIESLKLQISEWSTKYNDKNQQYIELVGEIEKTKKAEYEITPLRDLIKSEPSSSEQQTPPKVTFAAIPSTSGVHCQGRKRLKMTDDEPQDFPDTEDVDFRLQPQENFSPVICEPAKRRKETDAELRAKGWMWAGMDTGRKSQ
jgi:hypothetical protein